MSALSIASPSGETVDLHYVDWGQGRPVVLIHGWPVSHKMWEHQLAELPRHGLRVVAYDRRGFGASSQPWNGYDYDTFSDDLAALLDHLDLRDAVLVGFSMGGGEVARYLARHGSGRIGGAVFVAAVTPYLLQTSTNPSGVEKPVFDKMVEGLKEDRPAFLEDFGKQFFGVGLLSKPVSQATLDWAHGLALPASPKATIDCVRAFSETDFREDVRAIDVPTLIIHGTEDKTVPAEASAAELARLLPAAEYRRYEGAPHGLFITDHHRLTEDLIRFASIRG
ncbi:MAG: alpha/beta hydrolase [Xylophilus ampelinus]